MQSYNQINQPISFSITANFFQKTKKALIKVALKEKRIKHPQANQKIKIVILAGSTYFCPKYHEPYRNGLVQILKTKPWRL